MGENVGGAGASKSSEIPAERVGTGSPWRVPDGALKYDLRFGKSTEAAKEGKGRGQNRGRQRG